MGRVDGTHDALGSMRSWQAVEDVAGEHFHDWSIGTIVNGLQLAEANGSGLSSRCALIPDATVEPGGTYFGGEETKLVWAGSERVARVVEATLQGQSPWPNQPGEPYVFHTLTNHLGSASVTVNGAPALGEPPVVVAQLQLPYGNEDARVASASYGGWRPDYEYTGKEQDPDVGLMYFGARFYAPGLGRWVSADPLAVHGLAADLNCYRYVKDNPPRLVDPDGRSDVDQDELTDEVHPPQLPTEAFIDAAIPTLIAGVVFAKAIAAVGLSATAVAAGMLLVGSLTAPDEETARIQYEEDRYITEHIDPSHSARKGGATVGFVAGAAVGFAMTPRPAKAPPRSAAPAKTAAPTPTPAVPAAAGGAAQRGQTVLGHYPAYVQRAEQLGARRFNVPTEVWNRMTPAEQWAANQRFLDRMIARGDEIILATPASQARPGSFFARELEYLRSQGFTLSNDATQMLPPAR